MSVNLFDTLEPVGVFPVAFAEHIQFADNSNVEELKSTVSGMVAPIILEYNATGSATGTPALMYKGQPVTNAQVTAWVGQTVVFLRYEGAVLPYVGNGPASSPGGEDQSGWHLFGNTAPFDDGAYVSSFTQLVALKDDDSLEYSTEEPVGIADQNESSTSVWSSQKTKEYVDQSIAASDASDSIHLTADLTEAAFNANTGAFLAVGNNTGLSNLAGPAITIQEMIDNWNDGTPVTLSLTIGFTGQAQPMVVEMGLTSVVNGSSLMFSGFALREYSTLWPALFKHVELLFSIPTLNLAEQIDQMADISGELRVLEPLVESPVTVLKTTTAFTDSGDYRPALTRPDGTPAKVSDFINPDIPALVIWDTGAMALTFTPTVDETAKKLYLNGTGSDKVYQMMFENFDPATPDSNLSAVASVSVQSGLGTLSSSIGRLPDLQTVAKNSLVSAINEVASKSAKTYPAYAQMDTVKPADETAYKVTAQDSVLIADLLHHVTFMVEVVSPTNEAGRVLLQSSNLLGSSKNLSFVFPSAEGVGNPLVVVVEDTGIHLYGGHAGQTYSVNITYLP